MASIEFDHFIGYNDIRNGAAFSPNGQDYFYSAGGNLVKGSLMDSHLQDFYTAHDDNITSFKVSPTGKYVATGQQGNNSNVLVWDTATKEIIYTFEEHDYCINGLAFTHDEKILVTVGSEEDGRMILWDLSNGYIIAAAPKLPLGTTCVAPGGFVKDIKRRNTDHYLFATAGKDGLTIWDLDPYTGELVSLKLVGDVRATITRIITAISFTDDNEYIYGATTSGDYVIASLKHKRIMQAIQATKMGLLALLTYQDGVIIGCGDNTIKFFDINQEYKGQIQLDAPVTSLSLSNDRLEILAATKNGTIVRANIASYKYLIISESHTKSIVSVAFEAGRNDKFVTASIDGTLRVWDTTEYIVICTAIARREQERGVVPNCVALSDCILSGWSDGRVLAHSSETGANLWFIENAHQGGVTALTLSHNRRFILTGGPQGEVRLWELRSRELVSHLKEHVQKVTSITITDDDTVAYSGSRDRCILKWDLKLEKRVFCHMQRMGGINNIVLSRDESHILSVGQEKKLKYWHLSTPDAVHQEFLENEDDEGRCISISQDGRFVATGGTMGVVRLFRYETGKMITFVRGHSSTINSLSFSPDDKQIVSVGEDGSIFIWCVFLAEEDRK